MAKKSKCISNDIIVFSVALAEFEKLDFKKDALAGVRANYFNSKCKNQKDFTEVQLDGKTFGLSYNLEKNKPLSWKVSKDNRPFQSIKKGTSNVYCVLYYEDNGIISKRQYFDLHHNWIRTEYFDKNIEGKLICKISPVIYNDLFLLKKEFLTDNDNYLESLLYPSFKKPNKKCDVLIYSNEGMVWFDETNKPENADEIKLNNNEKKFIFNHISFMNEFVTDNELNLNDSEYLDECIKSDDSLVENTEVKDNNNYSAYDKIEKILEEAHKSNKDIFGEIINYTSKDDDSIKDNIEQDTQMNEQSDKDINNDEEKVLEENITEDEKVVSNACDDENSNNTKVKECENDRAYKFDNYKYYGHLDANSKRVGKGRTVALNGTTSYDGEYYSDLRNGFGISYYKNGNINYVGNWSVNDRCGAGVGYRMSDGTMHAGKWENNKPTEYGARFNSDGVIEDVCYYQDGCRNGLSVSFDEKGNLIISKWKNGEKIDERTVTDGQIFGNL